MIPSRLTLVLLLMLVPAALVACGDDEGDDGDVQRIEDLPSEARLFVYSTGSRPFDGDADRYLAILPFEPLYPRALPDDRVLQRATIVPSGVQEGKSDLLAVLTLEYGPEGDTATTEGGLDEDEANRWIQVTQSAHPPSDLEGAEFERVQVGGVEGFFIDFPDVNVRQVGWHDCGLMLTVTGSLERDALVAIGESMTSGCGEPGEVG